MGCDIHASVEIKVDNEWLFYSEAKIPRCYDLFARMADVRNVDRDIEPISSPRGLPSDISKMVGLHRHDWGTDGHSDSWISYSELCDLLEWAGKNEIDLTDRYTPFGVYLFGNSLSSWREYPDDYPTFIQDIRLVFWFNN